MNQSTEIQANTGIEAARKFARIGFLVSFAPANEKPEKPEVQCSWFEKAFKGTLMSIEPSSFRKFKLRLIEGLRKEKGKKKKDVCSE